MLFFAISDIIVSVFVPISRVKLENVENQVLMELREIVEQMGYLVKMESQDLGYVNPH